MLDLIAANLNAGRAIWLDTPDRFLGLPRMGRECRPPRRQGTDRASAVRARRPPPSLGRQQWRSYDYFPITQEQIADATGLTAVHTNRTLQVAAQGRLISLSSSRLVILDWEGLADVGDFNERYLHHTA